MIDNLTIALSVWLVVMGAISAVLTVKLEKSQAENRELKRKLLIFSDKFDNYCKQNQDMFVSEGYTTAALIAISRLESLRSDIVETIDYEIDRAKNSIATDEGEQS